MVRHIVMFKLTEFATPADKLAKMQEIKTGLEALIDKIDVLRLIRVDFNINPEETWDVLHNIQPFLQKVAEQSGWLLRQAKGCGK